MLVATTGKERTFPAYRAPLTLAGFEQIDYRRIGSSLDAILAQKA
jgi:hypothetical protein